MEKINYEIKIIQLDVGQGDSAIILFEGFDLNKKSIVKKSILIDGGAVDKVGNIKGILQKEKIEHLDAVVVSHLDQDHLMGVIELKKDKKLINKNTAVFRPSVKHYNAGKSADSTKKKWEKSFGTNFKTPKIGESIWGYIDKKFYDQYKTQLTLNNSLIPNLTFVAVDGNNIKRRTGSKFDKTKQSTSNEENNQISIASLLSFNKFNFYTSGDINLEQEEEISNYFKEHNIVVSVRKCSHHLAVTGSCKEQDTKMTNLVTIASYGKNEKYKHPHQGAIDNIPNNVFLYTTNPAENARPEGINHKKERGQLKNDFSTIVAGDIKTTAAAKTVKATLGNIFITTDTIESKENKFKVSCDRKIENIESRLRDYYIRDFQLINIKKRLKGINKSKYVHYEEDKKSVGNKEENIEQYGILTLSNCKYNVFQTSKGDILLRSDTKENKSFNCNRLSIHEHIQLIKQVNDFKLHKEILSENKLILDNNRHLKKLRKIEAKRVILDMPKEYINVETNHQISQDDSDIEKYAEEFEYYTQQLSKHIKQKPLRHKKQKFEKQLNKRIKCNNPEIYL